MTTAVLRQGTALQFAEKAGFQGVGAIVDPESLPAAGSKGSDSKLLPFTGLQPLRKRLEAFVRKLFSRRGHEFRIATQTLKVAVTNLLT